jgi:hypothetical protein
LSELITITFFYNSNSFIKFKEHKIFYIRSFFFKLNKKQKFEYLYNDFLVLETSFFRYKYLQVFPKYLDKKVDKTINQKV